MLVDQSNIDHALVGPGGIFAVETKAYSIFGNGCVGVDEIGTLRLSGKPAMNEPLGQAKASAAIVAKILKNRMRQKFEVTPVLILPGWTLKPAKAETGVVVLNDGTISNFFDMQHEVLTNDQITAIASHLDQAARS